MNASFLNKDENVLLESYTRLNNTFEQTLVFRLGDDAGFFSEYNGMILAMLYCLTHRIRFVLHSYKGNFAQEKGWTDFFLPFCEVSKINSSFLHTYANFRPYGLHDRIRLKDGVWRWQLKKRVLNLLFQGYKSVFSPHTYLTQDLWDRFFYPLPYYDIPELSVHGDIIHACHKLVQFTWRFNERTWEDIRALKSRLRLPDKYISCHIRGGDKSLEADLLTINPYMEWIKSQQCSDVFVLTDDYSVIEQLTAQYPSYRWYTLCEKVERGYFHQSFLRKSKDLKRELLIKLFASVDIIADSQRFLGTKTSNPSIFMDMFHPDISESVDSDRNMLYYILHTMQ